MDCGCSFLVQPAAFVDVTIALSLRIADPAVGAFQERRVSGCLLPTINLEYGLKKKKSQGI